MNIITISREMGSKGTALARLLARKLEYVLIDKELILRAAQKALVSVRTVGRYDQEVFNKANVVLERIFAINPPSLGPLALVHFPQDERISLRSASNFNQERYLAVTQYLLRNLARRGNVILLGRGGQIVLAGYKGALHLRVVAPIDIRVKRVSRTRGISEEEAKNLILSRDRACARYLKHFYRRDWADPSLYDLVMNTGRLSLQSAKAAVLSQFV